MTDKFDWLETPLGDLAKRIVEIAPDFASIKSVNDVMPSHVGLLAYALGVQINFHLTDKVAVTTSDNRER